MTATIRPAVESDRAAILRVHTESWRDTYRGMLPDTYLDGRMADDLAAKWAGRRLGAGLWVWVAEVEGEVVGLAACAGDGDPVLLDNLHVARGHRSHGLGARLLQAARRGMAERGRPRLYLTVLETNTRALDFYERAGGVRSDTIDDRIFDLKVRAIRLDWGPPGT
jgi:ribosomal protein S18 acetylase RimI-like enzyme